MEEWDPAINDFVLRCSSCWRTSKQDVKIIRTSREKYYCEKCWVSMISYHYWDFVHKHMPDYQEKIGWLKVNGTVLV
jgi:hypothetical protein